MRRTRIFQVIGLHVFKRTIELVLYDGISGDSSYDDIARIDSLE